MFGNIWSKPSGVNATAADESDDDAAAPGMMEMLQCYTPFPKATAKAKPKTTPRPKIQPTPSANAPSSAGNKRKALAMATPAPSAEGEPSGKMPRIEKAQTKVDQVGIGRLGETNGKQTRPRGKQAKRTAADDLSMDVDADLMTPADMNKSISLSDADQQTMNVFEEKFKAVTDLSSCPVPDTAFKTFLSEKQTAIAAIAGDLKAKKKSASRRALKENDPLHMAITDFQEVMNKFNYILKCFLSFSRFKFKCLIFEFWNYFVLCHYVKAINHY